MITRLIFFAEIILRMSSLFLGIQCMINRNGSRTSWTRHDRSDLFIAESVFMNDRFVLGNLLFKNF